MPSITWVIMLGSVTTAANVKLASIAWRLFSLNFLGDTSFRRDKIDAMRGHWNMMPDMMMSVIDRSVSFSRLSIGEAIGCANPRSIL